MRLVCKIGTTLLTREDNNLNTEFISNIVDQAAALHRKGHEIIIVTSGAVASGRASLTFKKETKNIPFRQALAAVGQTFLLNTYQEFFKKYGIIIAQILLTAIDFKERGNFLSTFNTLKLLLELRAVPIINENDVTAYAELKFGDNDFLSAQVASMVNADLLLILTDVPGLLTANPAFDPKAKLIPRVKKIDQKILKMAEGVGSKKSLGGMVSKIKAADYAVQSGIPVLVASGRIPDILIEVVKKNNLKGTYFPASISKKESRRKWLKTRIKKGSQILVDEGAVRALKKKGSSLLPSGVKAAKGVFERGDVVEISDLKGNVIGFGQVNYGSLEIGKIKGRHSDQISQLLGVSFEEEVIHRDNLVCY